MRYTVLIDGEAGAYGAVFPDCPGCTAMGDTIQEALDNAGEALRDWMESYTERGATPPEPRAVEQIVSDPEFEVDFREGAQLASVALAHSTSRHGCQYSTGQP